jgi:hypothetical protein
MRPRPDKAVGRFLRFMAVGCQYSIRISAVGALSRPHAMAVGTNIACGTASGGRSRLRAVTLLGLVDA